MLKRPITYTDFNGDSQTETFYFNLTKTEIIEMEVNVKGGMSAFLEKIIETTNREDLIKQFKKIILMAYGEKSDDGKRFVKSEERRKDFEQHAAFDALFTELSTNDEKAAEFVMGVFPKDLATEVEKIKKQTPEITSNEG